MPLCASCEAIEGKPSTGEPHPRQELVSRRNVDGAVRLDYVCRRCGSQMLSLCGDDLADEVWTVTIRPGTG